MLSAGGYPPVGSELSRDKNGGHRRSFLAPGASFPDLRLTEIDSRARVVGRPMLHGRQTREPHAKKGVYSDVNLQALD